MKRNRRMETRFTCWRTRAWAFVYASLFAASVFATASVAAQEAERDAFLTRAVLAGDQLWLRNDSGALSTIQVNGKERVPRPTAHPVADICAFDGEAIAVSIEDDGAWLVFRPDAAEQGSLSIKPVATSYAPLLDCSNGAISIIGSRQLVTLDRFGSNVVPRTVVLDKRIGRGLTTALYSDAEHLYVGTGNGEFGGDLWVVDRNTGAVSGGEDGMDLRKTCGEAVQESCAPVNDLAAIPWKPGCVAMAVGLQHMMSGGAVVELCGSSFRSLYRHPYTSGWLSGLLHGKSSNETVPFYAVLAKRNSLLVAGLDGLYEIAPNGTATIGSYPEFTRIGDVDVSFERADVVLVRTSVSARKALSSATPLMVLR